MRTPLDVLAGAAESDSIVPLFVHAHPDDETVQTGSLLAWLAAQGLPVSVLTCTRGEQGEIVSGVLPASTTADELVRVREAELAHAIETLGVAASYFLGTPPARAAGLGRRDYHDSGMRWVAEGLRLTHSGSPATPDQVARLTSARVAYEELAEAYDALRRMVERGYVTARFVADQNRPTRS